MVSLQKDNLKRSNIQTQFVNTKIEKKILLLLHLNMTLTEGSIPIAVAISSYISSHGWIPDAGCKFSVFLMLWALHL